MSTLLLRCVCHVSSVIRSVWEKECCGQIFSDPCTCLYHLSSPTRRIRVRFRACSSCFRCCCREQPATLPRIRPAPPADSSDPSRHECLLYTSDAADDLLCVDLGGRRIIKKKKK